MTTAAISPSTMIELVRETVLPDLTADFSVEADLDSMEKLRS